VRAQPFVLGHEEMADGVVAGLGQLDVEGGAFLLEELVRDLDEEAGAITGNRIRPHRTTVLEVRIDYASPSLGAISRCPLGPEGPQRANN